MKTHAAFWLKAIALMALTLTPLCVRAQMLDANANGISDVWEWRYGAYGLDPNADADGDGFSNLQEAIAGTNPFDAHSFPHISASASAGNINVTIPCALGKAYQLLSVSPEAGTNWVVETNIVARAGVTVIFSLPVSGAMKFYRVAVSDVDSDGDGLNDWEEYQLGLDPLKTRSNNQQDENGNAISDYDFAQARIAQQNVVTISAADPVTTRPDPGTSPTDLGMFTITRGGFPLSSVTINLGPGEPGIGFGIPGVDFQTLPGVVTLAAGVSSQNINLTPLANTNALAPVLATLQLLPGTGYTMGDEQSASVVIYPSATANGSGLVAQYFTNSSTVYTNSANFAASNLFLTRIDPAIDFTWSTNLTPNLSNGNYTVLWTGQLRPQYSETYMFDTRTDDGVRLWVNDQLLINKWQSQGATDWTNSIALQAGVLYDLKMEYLQHGGSAQAHLSWYSPSQAKQVIPSSCLYPTNSVGGSIAPSAITSPLSAVAFLGQPFSFTVTAANSPFGFSASGLPPGLSFNTTNGLISGVPNMAGNYQTILTASNALGSGASVVNIAVLDTGSAVTREIWINVAGVNIADIPTGSAANLVTNLGSLEGITDYGDNYGERIRGFLIPPTTGNYYFWIAGGDSAQLWISNDGEPVNKVLRAYVSPTNNPALTPQNGTASRQWNVQSNQQSAWLALTAGQKYYIEILHKAGVGAGDNWSVGWLQDPTGTNTAPTGVVPGYVLSRYFAPLPSAIPGTLYTANMLALPGVSSTGVGSATLRLNASGTQAVLNFQMNNLVGAPTGLSINSDPYLMSPGELIFDISVAKPQANGSYLWNIKAVGTLSAADVVEIINEGKAVINIESTAFAGGEIAGHFTAADGSQSFTAPPAPPSWVDDHADANAASRFLAQATFGPSANDIASVQSLGYSAWIDEQFALPATHHLPVMLANPTSDPTSPYPSTSWFNNWWKISVTAPDQLRQRVALALSEILVISENSVLQNNGRALASYYDILLDNGLGNYRQLLKAVTLSPGMGLYLNMLGNDKGSMLTGIHANENYAREVQQLFSVGLNRLWPDGTLILNSQGNLVPTYNQNVVMGFAAAFTGWTYYQTNQANGRLPSNFYPPGNYTNPMVLVPTHHDLGAKLLLDNVVLPPAQGLQAVSSNAVYDAYGPHDLEAAMDSLFYNQNVGPFICRQLIQRLVTSNPSRDYLYRVTQVFNDNSSGVRGDMQAVVRAILLDYEARSSDLISQPTFGKQREPLVRATALARAFPGPPDVNGTYSENGTRTITIVTASANRLNNGDTVMLKFTDTSGHAAPNAQAYSVSVTNATTFSVNAPNMLSGTYGETNLVITVNISGHGLAIGNPVYLGFTTGGAANGLYSVASVADSSHFTVTTSDAVTRSGNILMPKLAVGGYTQSSNIITISTTGAHGLNAGNNVFINFTAGSAVSGTYPVASVTDTTHFTIAAANSTNQNQNGLLVYPLVAMPLTRSGTVVVHEGTWNMGYTDTGSTSSLLQSPMRSPTVFNFFFPGYQFPGALASAGLTTPEFQLTSDTGVALQMNFLEGAILNNTGNTNGLSSFTSGNGSIVLDLGPWMTTNFTSAAGLPALVDQFNTLMLAGQLSAAAKSNIVKYATNTVNFSYSTPPTQTQMRDRVRAALHLLISSPDYIIQK